MKAVERQTADAARGLVGPAQRGKPSTAVGASGGFTLVELMVSSIIFIIFCLVFLNAAIGAMASQQFACDYYKALAIARNRIQRVRTFEYASLPLMNENQTPVDGLGNANPTGQFQRTTLVAVHTNGVPNLYKITVQVSYPGARRVASAQPVEINTLASERW